MGTAFFMLHCNIHVQVSDASEAIHIFNRDNNLIVAGDYTPTFRFLWRYRNEILKGKSILRHLQVERLILQGNDSKPLHLSLQQSNWQLAFKYLLFRI